ncbi:MAG: phosphoribosylglycinamide formyltransferase [Actinomycetota bacterium]|nr:phosphoribosylglycinamide formyltransferase [Actinomycetota bacterium]
MSGRIVVLISGSGSNMEALVEACERRQVPGHVEAVVADRECRGLRAAQERGIETHLIDFSSFDEREKWSTALRDVVRSYDPDLVVSAGFMRILAPVFVDAFPNKVINLHPALLPAFAGAHGVRDALAHGVKVTGSTVHFVDHLVDHGPILLQEAVAVEAGDTVESLHERIKQVEHRLLPEACRLILEGKVSVEGTQVRVGD